LIPSAAWLLSACGRLCVVKAVAGWVATMVVGTEAVAMAEAVRVAEVPEVVGMEAAMAVAGRARTVFSCCR
jgi:hypothetical protein